MSRYRSTSISVDDEGPQRWDREKFERYRTRGPPEREDLRYEERDRFSPRGAVRDVAVEDRIRGAGPRGGRYEEDFRYHEEDRHAPGRRRMDFMDEPIPAEVARQALAPYRRPQFAEAPMRRPGRPQFIRRQSSLDTFDRKPMPRYGDEYRLPADLPIPLPIRRPHSPPRSKYREEFEEISYKDLPKGDFDEYRDIRVRRERHGRPRSESKAAKSVRSSSSSSSSFEEITVPEPPKIGKKGKTRMPKRLVHKKAIVDMGLPFEEDDDFIIVQRALTKVHIDEIIEKSKGYREEKTIFKYTEERETETKEEVKEDNKEENVEEYQDGDTVVKKTTIIEGLPPPPPQSVRAPSVRAPSVRAPSPARTERSVRTVRPPPSAADNVEKHSNPIGGPLTVLSPDNRGPSEEEIRREIRELELERRTLRSERGEVVRRRRSIEDYELVEREDRWEDRSQRSKSRARSKSVVRIEKDRKGRLALVRSTH